MAIKILHTADWHLGANLQGWPREAEHRAALHELVAIAKSRAVDAVIVAGDIFDSPNPSAEAQRLLFETLRDLRAALPRAAITLVAGNHDPAGRLEAPRALFDLVGVTAIGAIARGDKSVDVAPHLVALKDPSGEVAGYALAAPYPRAADLPPIDSGASIVAAVRELYADLIGAARARIGARPLVVTGHLHVAGALESEGAERRILVGGEHAVPSSIFPDDVAYVALGHLHRPQSVGRANVRYAGSLFPLSKTEIDYVHGVTIATVRASGVEIEHAPLARPVRHLRLPAQGALAPSDVEAALARTEADPDAPVEMRPFVHLTVRPDGPAAGLKAEIDATAEKFPIRLVSVSIERPALAGGAPEAADPSRLSEREPIELFRQAFAREHGVEPEAEHLSLFHSLALED